MSLTVFFPIEKIVVTGSKIYSHEEILKYADVKKGDNLFTASRTATEDSLKKRLPYIESVDFEKEIPSTLKITVKDAEEFASYKFEERYYTVSKSGWVLEETYEPKEALFTIISKGVKCKTGSAIIFEDKAQEDLIDNITNTLKSENISTELIDVSDTVNITLRVENGRFDVNLGTANNTVEKIKHLGSMIEEISEEKSGNINLSMWTSDNTRGTFVAKNQ